MTRRGFSLVELVVALAMFSVLMTVALGFYRQQGEAFAEGNQRMTVMQNLRYGVNTVEQSLGAAGIGVPAQQPVVVYAGEDVLAFNADYATNVENDVFAVFYDRALPDGAVTAVTPSRRFVVPGTSFRYPSASYRAGSANSPAETITFFFAPDSATARPDDFVLFRQVNDRPPETVARRLLRTDRPFFRYYVLAPAGSGDPVVDAPAHYIPAAHTERLHGSPDDIGATAAVDSIVAVRLEFAATDGRPRGMGSTRRISRLVRLPNAGVEARPTCGDAPMLGSALLATAVDQTGSVGGHIRLEWARAVDEVSGERDVLRYVIWRKRSPAAPWDDPLASISPGASAYVYEDRAAERNTNYWYALAAQDCTPRFSALSTAGPVKWKETG